MGTSSTRSKAASAGIAGFAEKELAAKRDSENAETQRMLLEQKSLRNTEALRGQGYVGTEANQFERQAGVTPPGFEGFRSRETGKLLSDYSYDPYKSEMTSRLRSEALSEGPSKWAQGALQKQQYEQAQGLGRVGLEQQRSQAQAQSQLMRQGGLGGGARTSLARSGMRDALMAGQGIAAQGAQRRFDISDTDVQRKQDLTGTLADVERQGQLQDIGMLEKDVSRRGAFDTNRYNEQMKAWAANQQAAAQKAAGSGGGGGCFPGWTLVKLKTGVFKKMSDIICGDELLIGGKVTELHFFSGKTEVIYDYMGIDITGSHAVLEGTKWVRVKDSNRGIKTTQSISTVYNLTTELSQIWIGGYLFSDYAEKDIVFSDEPERESINIMSEVMA